MKKIIKTALCLLIAGCALTGCDTRDGRINDPDYTRNASMGYRDDKGVLHDAASMVGRVGEDVADGVDNMGSSITSDVRKDRNMNN
ncbi:MAG: hypothetical protein IIY78_05200 [Clostridia bacterium]|nr:hypothetical protein [Clostridia bacterium]